MNGINTTEGAPVVASQTAETKPVAKRTTKTATIPTLARRKVLMGKHKQTGAPRLEIIGLTKNPRRGAFTLVDIFNANGQSISLLTIKKRKNELLKVGKLVKMARDFKQHDAAGRPPEYFNFDLTKGEAKKSRTRKSKTTTSEAPVVAADPHPAIEEQPVAQPPVEQAPAPAEQPAMA